MCCFSPIAAPANILSRLFSLFTPPRIAVSQTQIFARIESGVQHLVYSMSLSTPADVAMVLPLPVVPRMGDAALRFVDLSEYPRFFDDVGRMLRPDVTLAAQPKGGISRGAPRLVVHAVGAFEASFVPSIADFDRLDERFRLPEEIWSLHREYRELDFGFAVFKLAKGKKKEIHPMAMSFPTREKDAIFFPTLHVHDGRMHEEATFDHMLYYQVADESRAQRERPDGRETYAMRSYGPARDGIVIEKTKGLVAPDQYIHAWNLFGDLANADTRVRLAASADEQRPAA